LWLLSWWRVFGELDGRRLRMVTFRRDDGRLVALAPLLYRRHWYRGALPFRRLELLATGEAEADEICSDYVGLIVERGAEEEVARAFAAALASESMGPRDALLLQSLACPSALP